MTLAGVVVHRVEGHATELYGPRPWGTRCADGYQVSQSLPILSLKPCHSAVSTDVLLFSEINLSLVHHYRVFRRGLPHYAFRKDYLSRLRVFVSQASAMDQCGLVSPVPGSSGSLRNVRPGDAADSTSG